MEDHSIAIDQASSICLTNQKYENFTRQSFPSKSQVESQFLQKISKSQTKTSSGESTKKLEGKQEDSFDDNLSTKTEIYSQYIEDNEDEYQCSQYFVKGSCMKGKACEKSHTVHHSIDHKTAKLMRMFCESWFDQEDSNKMFLQPRMKSFLSFLR